MDVDAVSGAASLPRISARISYDRTRAAWSWIAEATISSSAPVSARKPPSPSRTVSARADVRAGEHPDDAEPSPPATSTARCRRSAAAAVRALPRSRLVNDCCSEVKRRRASPSVVRGDDVDAEHRVRRVELLRRLEPRAVDLERRRAARPARSARRTRTAGRARRRAARRRGSSRGSRSARRVRRREPRARAGPAAARPK